MKKVIFVSGTSYSGSTFLHMTLGNDPHGFAGGEMWHLFHPVKEKHFKETWVCGCDDPSCQLWDKVKRNGEQRMYETIFDENPEVEFIVDSGKNVMWIAEQAERLEKKGIDVRHLVIWKTPLEFAHSLKKRNQMGRLDNWPRYHQLYASVLSDWRSVMYEHYTHDQDNTLVTLCDYLDIPYFPGKERFWEKTHHVLGGNLSSRIHLYSGESGKFQDTLSRVDKAGYALSGLEGKHRTIYYETPAGTELDGLVEGLYRDHPETARLEDMLCAYDVEADSVQPAQWADLRLSGTALQLKRLKQAAKWRLSKTKNAV